MNVKLISLVVPAYKQEKTIVKDLRNLDKVLSTLPCKHEIIVVVDGFVDKTYDILRDLRPNIKDLKVTGYKENRGKGAAIKFGVEKAKGDVIGFIDAGMDIDPSEISLMLDLMDWNKADIVVGSKLHPESKVNYPIWRKILSWGYRTLTHVLFGFSVKDTQVGFKIFRGKVAKDVFSRIIVKRFAFDIEVLTVAYKLGYHKIYEAPIKLNFRGANSITSRGFWKTIFWMLWDTAAVFYRLRITRYYDKKSKIKS
jgi:glycosyltransferase involved in cell wall biosynthesis